MILGIDPGLSGALLLVDPNHPLTGEAIDLAVHVLTRGGKKKRELHIVGLIGIWRYAGSHTLLVEQIGAMPGQGMSSVFAFGKCYGVILRVLASRSIPLSLLPAVRWKCARCPKGERTGRELGPHSCFPKPLSNGDWEARRSGRGGTDRALRGPTARRLPLRFLRMCSFFRCRKRRKSVPGSVDEH
jgi:crossover junction endodeoxyribonuclease RuvC